MPIRFRADNDFSRNIVRGVVRLRPEIDFLAEQLHDLDDASVLKLAASEDRVLVTHDVNTIPALFIALYGRSAPPGVILVSQRLPLRRVIDRLIELWATSEAEELRGQLRYL